MKKVTLCLAILCLFSHPVWAKGNAFCNGLPTSNSACVKGAKEMYQDFLKGYTDTAVRSGQISDGKVFSEIKRLLPYDLFHAFFSGLW